MLGKLALLRVVLSYPTQFSSHSFYKPLAKIIMARREAEGDHNRYRQMLLALRSEAVT